MKYPRWNVGLLKVLLNLGSHDRKLALIRLPTYLYMRGVHLRWALLIQLSYSKKQGYGDSPSGRNVSEQVLDVFV